jgi:hypothetical protein
MSKKTMRRKMRKETVTAAASPVVMTSAPKAVEFKPDYSYVAKDLRRIGMLAGSFIVLLVALSFFLR